MWVLIGLGIVLWLACGIIGSWLFFTTFMKDKGYISVIDLFILFFLSFFGFVGLGISYLETHGEDVIIKLKK